MFDTIRQDTLDSAGSGAMTPDDVEQTLIEMEQQIGRIRAKQLRLLRRADLMQLPSADGARSLHEWSASRLDISPELAADLVRTSRTIPDRCEDSLGSGTVSFCRAVATTRLAVAGASEAVLEASDGHDISGVRRLTAAHRRMDSSDEQTIFDTRHAAIQVNLDNTSANLWASLTGTDSQIVTQALHEWADRMPKLPDGTRDTFAHRQADALVAIFTHALGHDGESSDNATGGRGPHLLLTADLATLAESRGTKGVSVVGGPRIGINALEEALCNGSVSLDVKLEDGRVLGVGSTTDPIPPRVRQYVLARDQGCTADACRSCNHLQAHHILPRSQGGDNDPNNLTTLCWYHHHVVVHGMDYTVDPDSPPHRRRFLAPTSTDPP